jgi:hypothetical protein
MPGGIPLHHRRLDAGSNGPRPAPVGGMAWQPPASCEHDDWAVVAGLLPIFAAVARGSILLGHGVVPRGAWYANCLEGLMDLEPKKLAGVAGCSVWVGPASMVKMTILQFKQLMLEPFGAKKT